MPNKEITPDKMHICNKIEEAENKEKFRAFFELSKNYAPKMHTNSLDFWTGWWDWEYSRPNHLIREKYRFIKDVISILEKEEQQNG